MRTAARQACARARPIDGSAAHDRVRTACTCSCGRVSPAAANDRWASAQRRGRWRRAGRLTSLRSAAQSARSHCEPAGGRACAVRGRGPRDLAWLPRHADFMDETGLGAHRGRAGDESSGRMLRSVLSVTPLRSAGLGQTFIPLSSGSDPSLSWAVGAGAANRSRALPRVALVGACGRTRLTKASNQGGGNSWLLRLR